MKNYVLGFAFDTNAENVALIEKQRPDWQKGLLNGIGGHIEAFESPLEAMIREFREETGVHVESWGHYLTMKGHTWTCETYRAFDINLNNLMTTTDETIVICKVLPDRQHLLKNIRWLIELALDPEPSSPNVIHYAS